MDKRVHKLEQKVFALEGQVQGQIIGKCVYCNVTNILPHRTKIKPKFCMQCGRKIDYSLSKNPSLLKLDSAPQ